MKNYYGCWMHLSKQDNKILSPIISRLSKKYVNGNIFPPHISVSLPVQIELEVAKRIIDACVGNIQKFEVEMHSIRYSDKWSKTLFIQIKESKTLSNISNCLSKRFDLDSANSLDPHISLLYKKGVKGEDKKKLVDKLKVPKKYTVSNCALVYPGNNVNNWRDYSKWKVVYEKELK